MKQKTIIYLTNTYDAIGDGWLNIIEVDNINKKLVLMQDDENVYYFEPMYINDKSSMVYDYIILYKTKLNDFQEKISSDNIDQLTNYDLKTQYDVLKWLIYLIDNGDWSRHDDPSIRNLDIKQIIEVISYVISKYNKSNQMNGNSEYFINDSRLRFRWDMYLQYTLNKTQVGLMTTNNPYIVLYHNDYCKEMVFVNFNDLTKLYIINDDIFNEFYVQKINKFNYTKYHSSYQDELLMRSIFEELIKNQKNNKLQVFEINDKNELNLTNDVDYLRFSIDQYIENMYYNIENVDVFYNMKHHLHDLNSKKRR